MEMNTRSSPELFSRGYIGKSCHLSISSKGPSDNRKFLLARSSSWVPEEVYCEIQRVETSATCQQNKYSGIGSCLISKPANNVHCHICFRHFVCKADLLNHVLDDHYATAKKLKKAKLKRAVYKQPRSSYNKKPMLFECRICQWQFRSKYSLKRHLLAQHYQQSGNIDLQCSMCLQTFDCIRHLRDHIVEDHYHSRFHDQSFQCLFCEKRFAYKQSLTRHINHVHGLEKKYPCDVCGKKFRKKSDGKKHIRVVHYASAEKLEKVVYKESRSSYNKRPMLFKCGICQWQFHSKYNLKTHLLAKHYQQSGNADLQCSMCLQTFDCIKRLRDHIVEDHYHSRFHDQPFHCLFCEKRFAYEPPLTRHINDVHGLEKKYPCDVCGKKFRLKIQVKKHTDVVHRTTKAFQCEVCGVKISTKSSLKRHHLTVHPV